MKKKYILNLAPTGAVPEKNVRPMRQLVLMKLLELKIKFLIKKIKYGLILMSCQEILARFGVEIIPFYWVREHLNNNFSFEDEQNDLLKFCLLERDDLIAVGRDYQSHFPRLLDKLDGLSQGRQCLGVKYMDDFVGLMWFDLNRCCDPLYPIEMKNGEAYLFQMKILESFRGRGIAPSLRCESYRILNRLGVNKFYSLSDYFNSSSLNFKKKNPC